MLRSLTGITFQGDAWVQKKRDSPYRGARVTVDLIGLGCGVPRPGAVPDGSFGAPSLERHTYREVPMAAST